MCRRVIQYAYMPLNCFWYSKIEREDICVQMVVWDNWKLFFFFNWLPCMFFWSDSLLSIHKVTVKSIWTAPTSNRFWFCSVEHVNVWMCNRKVNTLIVKVQSYTSVFGVNIKIKTTSKGIDKGQTYLGLRLCDYCGNNLRPHQRFQVVL